MIPSTLREKLPDPVIGDSVAPGVAMEIVLVETDAGGLVVFTGTTVVSETVVVTLTGGTVWVRGG